MKIKVVLLLLLPLVLLSCARMPVGKPHHLIYQCDALFETRPWERPYYFPLKFGYAAFVDFDFSRKPIVLPSLGHTDAWRSGGCPTTGYIWAFNSGEIAVQNRAKSEIYVLDYARQLYAAIRLPGTYNGKSLSFWLGPHDDIYAMSYSSYPE